MLQRFFRRLRIAIILAGLAGMALFLHYTLPQRDIVRIVDVYERRVDFGSNWLFWTQPPQGTAELPTRDVLFIDSLRPDGRPAVYRNEDTGFGWPPYFKFDSANLNAEAKALTEAGADPVWVAITHYGWRSQLISIYPNAVSIRLVEGPETRLFPWFNTIFLVVIGLLTLVLYRLGRRFIRRRLEDAEDALETGGRRIDRIRHRLLSRFRR